MRTKGKVAKVSWEFAPVVIPKRVIVSGTLSSAEKLLFGIIMNLCDSPFGCIATNKFLGNIMGCNAVNAYKKLHNLISQNYIISEYNEQTGVRTLTIAEKYRQINCEETHTKVIKLYRY